MVDRWLDIIGLGEDGLAGLSPVSRAALAAAEIVFGGPRHLALANDVQPAINHATPPVARWHHRGQ